MSGYNRNSTAIDISLCSPNVASDFNWEVVDDTLGSNHFPIIIRSDQLNLEIEHSIGSKKWNLENVDWKKYAAEFDEELQKLDENISYNSFINTMEKAATNTIRTH
ncbi:hypothetical protein HHI36_022246 [Cryptolaemus montrouzieri]|uniref:Uncharacterized protein n=1 Tax=Cryptolaemus montrouzieri TaxID=559131 RepID=A0ABD2MZA2_9CUCU